MIIYPPGTQASNHHHEGAEHFMYVTQGRGTAFANEAPLPVRKAILFIMRTASVITSEVKAKRI